MLVPGTDDTISKGSGSNGGRLSNEVKVALIVGGLVAVGGLIGGLTYAYWRHTRPDGYLEALDVLGETSRGADDALVDTTLVGATAAPPSEAAGAGLGATSAVGSVGASALGAVAAERASSSRHSTTAQTQAFRIVGPVSDKDSTDSVSTDPASPDVASTDEVPAVEAGASEGDRPKDPAPPEPTAADGPAAVSNTEPAPVDAEDPPPIVTLEDLFGDTEPERALGSETARRVTLQDLFGDEASHADERPSTSS